MHESYQPVAGLLSKNIILTDFKKLLLVLAVCCCLVMQSVPLSFISSFRSYLSGAWQNATDYFGARMLQLCYLTRQSMAYDAFLLTVILDKAL
jgi:hypothetical protein